MWQIEDVFNMLSDNLCREVAKCLIILVLAQIVNSGLHTVHS